MRNIIIAIVVVIVLFAIKSLFPEKNYSEKYDGYDLTASIGNVSTTKTYADYLNSHKFARKPQITVDVDVLKFDDVLSTGTHIESNYHGKNVVITDDRSSVTWYVNVPQEGFYNISMEYIAVPSRNVTMERSLYINDEVPFNGADILAFYRLWKDGGEIRYDNRGNSIRPSQIEEYKYQTVRFKSDLGYEVDPYRFYFEKGRNKITMVSSNEPIAISQLALVPVKTYESYETYLSKQNVKPENSAENANYIKIQGENSSLRSDPSLFARYDRASAITEPCDVSKTVLNYTGGDSWKAPGQWIEWDADIPEDGYYTISISGRQLYTRGYIACRSLYIDGEIPISEVKTIEFPYSSDWIYNTISNKAGNPYKFYMTKGIHKIRLEVTLGELGAIISSLQDSILRLNNIYRTILVLTGTIPDQFRDYELDKVYPDQIEAMMLESRRLYKVVDDFVGVTGGKSEYITMAERLAVQLEQFYKRPDKITKSFQNFKDNITSLGSALQSLTESKLDIDYIELKGSESKVRPVRNNLYKKIKHELVSFVTSFTVDSTSLGNVYDEDSEHLIEVWIVTGRDQSQILKNMIDDSFTPNTGINVNVKLIDITALLNAVVSGNGPDVVVTSDAQKPVDYALRNASVDLHRFDDCDEVLSRFYPSAYEPYKYDGGIYALPETQVFNLLFYRKDILQQLGLEVPKTWDELIEILPTLQGNNLNVGISFPTLQAPEMSVYYSMVYQNGGTVYNPAGTKSVIDSEEGISAFKMYTSFFNSYGLQSYFDFLARFRSGEYPIALANYANYNSLVVSAPEIRGLWDFTYLLGTKKQDSNGNTYIDRSTVSSGACTMMIKKGMDLSDVKFGNNMNISYNSFFASKVSDELTPNVDENTFRSVLKNEARMYDAWEFMKWWTSSDIQVRFGREIEALLGASARYQTANIDALKQLSWSSSQIEVLENSLKDAVGVPEVPGSYYTNRYIINGARRVVNNKEDPRETLIDYNRYINEELTRKRQEFKLPISEE